MKATPISLIFDKASYCSTQNIPLFFHSPYHWELDPFPFDEFSISRPTLNYPITEDDLASQQRDTRPVQELDPLVGRIVASVVQVSCVVQPPRCEVALRMPDDQICI